jgi:hypothetical protein
MTMQEVAGYCRRAEEGAGNSAAREIAKKLDQKSIDRLIEYSKLTEDDITSFYTLGQDVEISGMWGNFTLSATPGKTKITPIGLYALASALKDLPSDDGF